MGTDIQDDVRVGEIVDEGRDDNRPYACIIGAGSSGLVTAKYLLEAGWKVVILEGEKDIGGVFRYKSWTGSEMVSSVFTSCFSDFRRPEVKGGHMVIKDYVTYMEEYAEKFQLKQFIDFNCRVTKVVAPGEGSGSDDRYTVFCTCTYEPTAGNTIQKQEQVRADAVIVCSGLHYNPHVPDILKHFKGEVMHSVDYKDKSQLAGKRVLIVGSGETGHDVCAQAATVAKEVTLCSRSGYLSAPKDLFFTDEGFDGPLDTFITNMFEHYYTHPWLDSIWYPVRWWVSTIMIKIAFFLTAGTTGGFNQQPPEHHKTGANGVKRGYHFIMKTSKALPYLNQAHYKKTWLKGYPWRWWTAKHNQPREPAIDSVKDIVMVKDQKIHFNCKTEKEFDMVFLATGYEQKFPFLDDKEGAKLNLKDPHALPAIRGVVHENHPMMPFIGFVRPNVGAIPPIAEMQIMWWLQYQAKKIPMPLPGDKGQGRPMYKLLSKCCKPQQYGVDFGMYMHALGNDMGSSIDIVDLLLTDRSPDAWKVAYVAALGQAYTPLFRIKGPYASDDCRRVVATELYDQTKKRGTEANVLFIFLLFVFGYLNLLCWVVDRATDFIGLRSPTLPRCHDAIPSWRKVVSRFGFTCFEEPTITKAQKKIN